MKVCPTCGVEKETDQFHKSKATKDGLNWQCKACHSERMRVLNTKVSSMPKPVFETKRCQGCKETKAASEFSKNRVMRDGLNSVCKVCDKELSLFKAQQNRDKNSTLPRPHTGNKKCSKCGIEKDIIQFSKSLSTSDALAYWCKPCMNEFSRLVVVKNRERNRQVDPHLDQSATKKCASCQCILPIIKFGKLVTTKSGLNPFCVECHKLKSLAYSAGNRERILFLAAKSRANKKGIPFDLELSDIIFPETCPALGFRFGDTKELRPSLDRIIPELGYVKGNVVVVSMRANRIKSDATANELEMIASFYKNLTK